MLLIVCRMCLSMEENHQTAPVHSNRSLAGDNQQIKKYVWVNALRLFVFVYSVISMFAIAYLFNNICILQNDIANLELSVYALRTIMAKKLESTGPTNQASGKDFNFNLPIEYVDKSDNYVEERPARLYSLPGNTDFSSSSRDDTNQLRLTKNRRKRNIDNGEENYISSTTEKTARSLIFGPHEASYSRNLYRPRSYGYTESEEEDSGTYMSKRDEESLRDAMRMYRTRRPINVENLEESKARHLRIPAVHYDGDTSNYDMNRHAHYNGNGHLRHLSRKYVDWKPAHWIEDYEANKYFEFDNGVVTIKKPGLYLIYAQIYYLDVHDTNAFRVYRDDETLLQCTVTSHSVGEEYKGNTCYTSGVIHLSEGDEIHIGDLSDGRYSIFEEGKSFFGLVKLDSRIVG